MRIIDQKWTDLGMGFQAAQTLQEKLVSEFGRAVDAGYRHKYRRDLNDWQKKRRIFLILVSLSPLPFITLCILTFYFKEVACVLAWWLVTGFLVLLATGVAAGSYIKQMVSGRPAPRRATVAATLGDQWWDSVSSKVFTFKEKGDRHETEFLALLFHILPDEWLAIHNLINSSDTASYSDIVLFGPSGIWVFEVVDWNGIIIKNEGEWKRIHKKTTKKVFSSLPDEEWSRHVEAIKEIIKTKLPHLAWVSNLISGGVVFSNPKVTLDKSQIIGNAAPYGLMNAWQTQLLDSKPDTRFTMEIRLEIMDAISSLNRAGTNQAEAYSSSKDEAERLYNDFANRLREHLKKIVK